jgi:hypothetical protein
VLFDDGSSSLARPAEAAETARGAAPLPDLGVLFSNLGLREVPATERRPIAPPDVEPADDDVVEILDEDD